MGTISTWGKSWGKSWGNSWGSTEDATAIVDEGALGGIWKRKVSRLGHRRQRNADTMRTVMLVYGSGIIR